MKNTDSLEHRIRNMEIDVPDGFHDSVLNALGGLNEKEDIKMKKFTFCAIALAAALILVPVSIALAVGTFGILDFFESRTRLTPRSDATGAVYSNLGSLDMQYLRAEISEAVYDGECVRTLIKLDPIDPQKYALYVYGDEFTLDPPPDGGDKTQLAILYIDIQTGSDSFPFGMERRGMCARRDGDSLLIYLEDALDSDGEAPDELPLSLSAAVKSYTDKNIYSEFEILFDIKKSVSVSAEYAPMVSEVASVKVDRVETTLTPFAQYLNVYYTVKAPDAMIEFIDGVTYYGTPAGIFLHVTPDCNGMRNASVYTAEEARATKRALCPECAGGSADAGAELSASFSWRFDWLENPSADEYGKQFHMQAADREYRTTLVCPSADHLPETLTLTLENGDAVYEIPCVITR